MSNRIQKWLPILTFHFLFLALPLIFTASSDELFEFPKILVIYGSAIVFLFAWIYQSIRSRHLEIPRSPLEIPVGAFVLSQIISTIISLNIHTSLFGYYSRFNGGLLSVFSYVIIFYAAQLWIRKENALKMLVSLLIGGALAALYAFPEHFGHSPSCYLITGQFTADCWIQDVQTRVFGTLGQPNWLAAMMVVLMPLTMAFIQNSKFKIQKTLWTFVFILFSLVLIYTKSRSGIFGAGLALTMQLFFTVLFNFRSKFIQKNNFQFILPTVLLATFCLLLLFIANPVRDKLEQLIHLPTLSKTTTVTSAPTVGTQLDTGGSESGDIRKIVWSGALKVWVRYPIFGSGVETFAYSYYKDRPREHNMLSEWDFLYNKAHNEFLNYLATTGAVGLMTYVLMYGSFIVFPVFCVLKEMKQESSESLATRYVLLATSSSLAGLAVSNFFGFSTVVVSMYTFVLPALVIVLSEKGHILTVPLSLLLRKKIIGQILLVATLVSCLSSLISVYRMYSIDVDYAASKAMIAHQDVETGVALLQSVVDSAPDEPVYRDELAYTAARLSYALGSTGDSTSAAKFAQAAIDNSDEVLTQNHANVNFYKTRARIFTLLGQLSPVFYKQAIDTLTHARDLSPTDPKLTYNMAIVANAQGDNGAYEQALRETLTLRPIDVQARLDLAKLYENEKRTDDAKREYGEVLKLDPSNKEVKDRIASLSATPKKK